MHGHGGWFGSYMRSESKPPKVTRELLMRVLTYARPYQWQIIGMLVMILIGTGLSLLIPLIFRRMIDVVIPAGDLTALAWLALALLVIPALNGLVGVVQRQLNAKVGEGVIYDLRVALYGKLQRMSLRFFTHTKTGELMSRLNSDVVGAQNAISNTIVGIITNLIEAAAILIVMLTLEWRLTLVSVIILPLFILVSRKLGDRLREFARRSMELNAQMNAHMNETLNIGGALLVKLFGRTLDEEKRFRERAASVRDIGIQRAVYGTAFFATIGLVSAVGTALVYGFGGYLVIAGAFTIGTIVAFGSYLGSLYGALQGLANAPVEFSTSVVSFERVFELIDLPQDIAEKPGALELQQTKGELVFDDVTFNYAIDENNLLSDVKRYGSMENVTTVLSLELKGKKEKEERECRRRGGGVQIPGAGCGFGAHLLHRRTRTIGRARGSLRRRQDHADLSHPAAVRPGRGTHPARRARPPGCDARLACDSDRHGHAGILPVPRHHPHQPDLRQTGCDPGGDRGGRARREHPRFHHRPAGRLRHGGGRARISAERRREAAHRAGARDPQGPAHPRAGRSHIPFRFRVGIFNSGCAQAGDGGTHIHRHRAPAEHYPRRGPDPGH